MTHLKYRLKYSLINLFDRKKRQVNDFHKQYYNSRVWQNHTLWRGVKILKTPMDLWVYQEIIHEIRPDFIIETGTFNGGSAYYLASICELQNHGQIISIDIEFKESFPKHKLITYLTGSSTSPEILEKVGQVIPKDATVMVILDSDHRYQHVIKELELYSKRVSLNSYLIVEDTNINGFPVLRNFGKGAKEAVLNFMETSDSFITDWNREKFMMTFNPGGYLNRVK